MKFGDKGMAILREREGYHTKLPDGRCKAYLDKLADPPLWTIGYGCTEGVYEGLVWTAEQAETRLREELEKHEAYVTRLVTVPINQHQFDALVCLCYNIGPGRPKSSKGKTIPGLSTSTLLRRLNAGDYQGAAKAFAMWNRGGHGVLPGLVTRRAMEAALFLTPVDEPDEPTMAQRVQETPPRPVAKPARDATGGAVATGVSFSLFQPWTWPWGDWVSHLGCSTGIECASALGSYSTKPIAMVSIGMIVAALWMAKGAKA